MALLLYKAQTTERMRVIVNYVYNLLDYLYLSSSYI